MSEMEKNILTILMNSKKPLMVCEITKDCKQECKSRGRFFE